MELLEIVVLDDSLWISGNHVAAAPSGWLMFRTSPIFEPHILNLAYVAVSGIETEVLEGD